MNALRSNTGTVAGNKLFAVVVEPLLTGTIGGAVDISRLVATGLRDVEKLSKAATSNLFEFQFCSSLSRGGQCQFWNRVSHATII